MRAKSMALLMLALGCGLVASIGITQVMAKRNTEPAPAGETQPVIIAVKDIPLGERLTAEYLKLEPWPKDKIPQGSVAKIEDIEGCRSRTKIYAGEPILEKKLLGKGASLQGDSALIPKGYRVVPVKVDNVSGGPGLIMPGDRVDVLVHLVRNPSQDIQDTSTRTILQDIKVFAVNDVVDMEREKDSKDKDKMNAKTISLLVTPAQAAKLTLASELGKLRLTMRSPEDDTNSLDGTANPAELFGESKKAVRDKEKLFQEPPLQVKNKENQVKNSLTDFLNSMKQQLAANVKPVISTKPSETWTIRILQPSGINELVMEADNGPQAAKMPQGAWHVNSTYATGLGGSATNNNNVKKQPPPAIPAVNIPAPQAGPPPSEPAVKPNAGQGPDLTPQVKQPLPKDPFADPNAEPSDDTNKAKEEIN